MTKLYTIILLVSFAGTLACQSELKSKTQAYHKQLKKGLSFQIGKDHVPDAKYFSYKPALRLLASLEKAEPDEDMIFTTFEGTNKTLQTYGKLHFELDNTVYHLLLFREGVAVGNPMANKYLLLPFTDETNGVSTYGGGRYIQVEQADIIDDKLWLDFNYAYTPWCAFAVDYSCPVPPKENSLNIKIKAGEKYKE